MAGITTRATINFGAPSGPLEWYIYTKPDDEYSSGYGSEPAEATGKVVAWLATDPTADKFLGKWIFAPKLCSDLGLLPGWTFQAPQ